MIRCYWAVNKFRITFCSIFVVTPKGEDGAISIHTKYGQSWDISASQCDDFLADYTAWLETQSLPDPKRKRRTYTPEHRQKIADAMRRAHKNNPTWYKEARHA